LKFSFSGFSIDSGVLTTQEGLENDVSSSMTTEKLYNELQRVKEDLKSKDNEIRRANEIRENTDREIEDLTASLFEVMKKINFEF
jgi:predicted  nucleic acid-binding Zn-ribbon protein